MTLLIYLASILLKSSYCYNHSFPIASSVYNVRGFLVWDDLPEPFMVESIKIWPVHSRPEFKWFMAYGGKPFYFQTKAAAVLFAKEMLGLDR